MGILGKKQFYRRKEGIFYSVGVYWSNNVAGLVSSILVTNVSFFNLILFWFKISMYIFYVFVLLILVQVIFVK